MTAVVLLAAVLSADPREPVVDDWDLQSAMKNVAATSNARPVFVLHIGDSITYANPYSQWARYGKGQTPDQKKLLAWMHAGKQDDTDGWYLASHDQPSGRSHTAASGLRADQLLQGGFRGLPSLEKLLATYRPQVVVYMLGTNDAGASRKPADVKSDYEQAVKQILAAGAVPILSTIPPRRNRQELVAAYNQALVDVARAEKLPLIDYYGQIVNRRAEDWDGTLISGDGVHPSAKGGNGATATSEPTDENLSNSGYLLRCWLSVEKIGEVQQRVLGGE